MGKHNPNPRLVKIHRNYTVEEAAKRLGFHKNTIREWIKRGLKVIDDQRPTLILGSDLFSFLQVKRKKNKRPCKPEEMYCFRCKKPKLPALNMAEYQPRTATQGNLFGICQDCDTGMYKAVNLIKLKQIKGKLDITISEGVQRLIDSGQPSVNSDFR
jgi:hypothetical protein